MKIKTRSKRMVFRKTPGGRVVIHYEDRRPNLAKCAICKLPLRGVPNLRPIELRKLPKSSRRPTRTYGGMLDHKCLEELIKKAVRGISNGQSSNNG
ncbi:MAG: 50S ribosomal protein L34e [Candidatus Methanomethylicia archaeon]|nr:50S ribosomal protein L34e [Candidatus Methanomethylicia archaeon]MCX8168966.1 50S ribosomal protein L34e [Candidatus Methanomethylicia archaeon]MDW7988698.1 50S ribosomal protein L34e [Nitrososphaerota archaeon]